ncbi:MAG: helix-turn-helix domain containing protein [Planctomycetes bacterium]|nr:helix-turn-helix domain containing protein [Planctomycetota bacterium]MCC8116244.1 helix-turn-helix domain containing protein [Planctomycetota bacterium]
MLDKTTITRRFFSCHAGMSRSQVGKIYGVKKTTVVSWAKRNTLSWWKLKIFCDGQAINWDWILEGVGDKHSQVKRPKQSKTKRPRFDTAGINSRFLSLYEGKRQFTIAEELGVAPNTISAWNTNLSKVPWEKMEYAVDKFGVRWDWLIDGLEPKYRDQNKEKFTD